MTPTVADIQALPDGFPVVDLKVRVERVGKPFENEGQQGKWFRQSVLVSDSTGQIEVSRSWDAKDGDPYRLEAGMMVLVSAKPSNKGGQLVGVQKTTYTNKKTGVTSPQIRARAGFVTPFAVLEAQRPPDGRLGSYGPIEGDRGSTGAPVASGGHSRPTPQPVRAPSGAMTEEEACELLTRNYRRLVKPVFERYGEMPAPTSGEIAAWATSIFIAVGRGDVTRDPVNRPAPEPFIPSATEASPRSTRKSAEEIVLEKARAGGYDETEPGEDDPWTFGG